MLQIKKTTALPNGRVAVIATPAFARFFFCIYVAIIVCVQISCQTKVLTGIVGNIL